MNEPSQDDTSYAVAIVRKDGSRLVIETGVTKVQAEKLRSDFREFFRDVLVVWQPQSKPGADS
jgi:hypothetical protein